MQPSGMSNVQEVISALTPLLTPRLGADASPPERTVSEGLVLPDGKTMLQSAIDPQKAALPLAVAAEWIRMVLRAEYRRAGWEKRLLAVPGAVNGQDAVIGAWSGGGLPIQVVVTLERVHVITRLGAQAAGDQQAMARHALEAAIDMLEIAELPGLDEWKLSQCAGLLLGRRQVDFPTQWFQTLLFLTDGRGVKYSVMTYKDHVTPEFESAAEEITPWF